MIPPLFFLALFRAYGTVVAFPGFQRYVPK